MSRPTEHQVLANTIAAFTVAEQHRTLIALRAAYDEVLDVLDTGGDDRKALSDLVDALRVLLEAKP